MFGSINELPVKGKHPVSIIHATCEEQGLLVKWRSAAESNMLILLHYVSHMVFVALTDDFIFYLEEKLYNLCFKMLKSPDH